MLLDIHSNQNFPPLYKYRRFDKDENDLRILTHLELWFANAKTFNDPFDTSITYNFDGHDGEMAERWSYMAIKRLLPFKSPQQRQKIRRERLAEIRKPDYVKKIRELFIEDNYNKFGICSLTTQPDNLLMWAHYSESHTGFCVGLSYSEIQKIRSRKSKEKTLIDCIKVDYEYVMPNLNFFECMIQRDEKIMEHLYPLISTKSIDWQYEDEVRLVGWGMPHKAISIPPEAIVEIYLGYKITPQNRDYLLRLKKKIVPHARVFQMVKDDHEFKLNPRPLE